MLQKGNYLKLETRYVKTVFRNGIYDKFCIRMGVFWIFDKIEENRYFFQRPSTLRVLLLLINMLSHQNIKIVHEVLHSDSFVESFFLPV